MARKKKVVKSNSICRKPIIQGILCNAVAREVDIVVFSGKTLDRDINEMAPECFISTLEEVRARWFLILILNKNTDVSDAAQLHVYILCLDEEHFAGMF